MELPSASGGFQGQNQSSAGRKRKQLINPDDETCEEPNAISKVGKKLTFVKCSRKSTIRSDETAV